MDSLSMKQVLRSDTTTQTLLAGLMLGITGDSLLRGDTFEGPGLSAWIFLLGATSVYLNNRANKTWRRVLVLWASVAFAASLLLVLRASLQLLPLVLLVIVTSAVIVLMQASSCTLAQARLRDYARSAWQLPMRVFTGFFPLLAAVHWRGLSKSSRVLGLVKGALLSLPLLFVFVGLFAAADANYDRYVSQFLDTIGFVAPQHILFILLFSWFSTGLLRCAEYRPVPSEARGPRISLGAEETLMVMGSLALLFLSFVVLQASYLFGGQAVLEARAGMTAADYARRGFFELIVVASLTLAVLLWLCSVAREKRVFLPLAYVLLACVFVILASALQRLSLYIESFGLSLSRVFAVAFIVWLAGNLLSFAATSARGRERGFASGLLVSGVLTIFLVALANPAAVVARVNLERPLQANAQMDWHYLLNLGPDAVPTLLRDLPQLPKQVQCEMANALLRRYGDESANNARDWRSWNYGHARARSAVGHEYDALFRLSGREQAIAQLAPQWPQRSALIALCGP